MKSSLGCAVTGLLLLLVLSVAFFLLAAIEPGLAILTMIVGIIVAAGSLVAFVVWVVEAVTSRRP